jgi:hypothetical protein
MKQRKEHPSHYFAQHTWNIQIQNNTTLRRFPTSGNDSVPAFTSRNRAKFLPFESPDMSLDMYLYEVVALELLEEMLLTMALEQAIELGPPPL